MWDASARCDDTGRGRCRDPGGTSPVRRAAPPSGWRSWRAADKVTAQPGHDLRERMVEVPVVALAEAVPGHVDPAPKTEVVGVQVAERRALRGAQQRRQPREATGEHAELDLVPADGVGVTWWCDGHPPTTTGGRGAVARDRAAAVRGRLRMLEVDRSQERRGM